MKNIEVLSIAFMATFMSVSCSKEVNVFAMNEHSESSANGSILIQESHIKEPGNLQLSAYFLDEEGRFQDFGNLKIDDVEVVASGMDYSKDDLSTDLIGNNLRLEIMDGKGSVIGSNSIYLSNSIQAIVPDKIGLGDKVQWNVDEEAVGTMVEIKLRYSSSSPYNEAQGFVASSVRNGVKVEDGKGIYEVDELLLKDVPDGAWVDFTVSRTLEEVISVNYKGKIYSYPIRWISTDMKTIKVEN